MNIKDEPGFLVADFCRETGRIDPQTGNEVFDFDSGSNDRKAFMQWINIHHADTWKFICEGFYGDGDDEDFLMSLAQQRPYDWQ